MTIIPLPAQCNRAAAESLLPELLCALDSGRIEIDGRQVEQIGQAMLQLLLSARRSGDGVTILPSPALAQTARLTGLSDELFGEIQP